MDAFLFDLRLAVRGLQRNRAFVVTSIATLAVVIALNVIVFTVRDAMLFRGLPQAERSDRLVYLAMRKPSDMACCPGPILYSDYQVWRAEARSFEGLSFGRRNEPIAFAAGSNRPIDMVVSRHTANTFSLLGIQPQLGRDFVASDEAPGAPAVAMVSHQFWEQRLGKRGDIVGLPVTISGTPATIVGVLPETFALVYEQELFMPFAGGTSVEGHIIGRLHDGATLEQARVEIETITGALQEADPATTRGVPLVRTYAQAHVAPDAPRIYGTLFAGAWFVLLVGCANLANLSLVRTVGRWREFSTRIALGAAPRRMVRQILLEHLAVAGVAAPIAWLLTRAALNAWAEATKSPYLALDYSVTSGTLAYLLSIAAGAAIVIALVPSVRVMQLGVKEALKGEARGVTQGPRGKQLTTSLLAFQMALAIVLLLGAGVLVRSFSNVVGADTGVRDAEGILMGSVRLPSDQYPNLAARAAFFGRLDTELRAVAGTDQVSIANTFPTRSGNPRGIEVEGRPSAPDGAESAQVVSAAPGYFSVMGRPTISGRDFTARDVASAPLVVLVNESFAAAWWPGEQPVGKRLRTVDRNVPGPWRMVVGVVPNIMQGDATRQVFKPIAYFPLAQQAAVRVYFFVRTSVPPGQVAQAAQEAVRRIDSELITENVSSLKAAFAFDRDFMDLEHADLGKHAAIAPVFAVVALVLSSIGLMAIIAHSVTLRTKEIGVRMAVGAATRDIATMIVGEAMRPVLIGLVLGLIAAAGANRLLQSQLVGVSAYDPVTMFAGPLTLIVVALVGCHIPARRAMNVNPVVALRHE